MFSAASSCCVLKPTTDPAVAGCPGHLSLRRFQRVGSRRRRCRPPGLAGALGCGALVVWGPVRNPSGSGAAPPGRVPLPWCLWAWAAWPRGCGCKKNGPLRGPVRDWSGGLGIAPDRLSPGALLWPPNRNERRIRSRSCRRPTADLAPWEPPGCSRRSDGGRRHRGCASARTHRCCAGWGARRRCCTHRHRRWGP